MTASVDSIRALMVEPLPELVYRGDVRVNIVARHIKAKVIDGPVAHYPVAVPNEHAVGAAGPVLYPPPLERVVFESRDASETERADDGSRKLVEGEPFEIAQSTVEVVSCVVNNRQAVERRQSAQFVDFIHQRILLFDVSDLVQNVLPQTRSLLHVWFDVAVADFASSAK